MKVLVVADAVAVVGDDYVVGVSRDHAFPARSRPSFVDARVFHDVIRANQLENVRGVALKRRKGLPVAGVVDEHFLTRQIFNLALNVAEHSLLRVDPSLSLVSDAEYFAVFEHVREDRIQIGVEFLHGRRDVNRHALRSDSFGGDAAFREGDLPTRREVGLFRHERFVRRPLV